MGNGGIEQIAMAMLSRNSKAMNSPMGQQLTQIIQNGDEQAGIQMAQNICRANGISVQQAMQQISNSPMGQQFSQFFGGPRNL